MDTIYIIICLLEKIYSYIKVEVIFNVCTNNKNLYTNAMYSSVCLQHILIFCRIEKVYRQVESISLYYHRYLFLFIIVYLIVYLYILTYLYSLWFLLEKSSTSRSNTNSRSKDFKTKYKRSGTNTMSAIYTRSLSNKNSYTRMCLDLSQVIAYSVFIYNKNSFVFVFWFANLSVGSRLINRMSRDKNRVKCWADT